MKDIMDLDFGLGHQEEREKQQTMLNEETGPFKLVAIGEKMMWNTNKSLQAASTIHPKIILVNFLPHDFLSYTSVSSDHHIFLTIINRFFSEVSGRCKA